MPPKDRGRARQKSAEPGSIRPCPNPSSHPQGAGGAGVRTRSNGPSANGKIREKKQRKKKTKHRQKQKKQTNKNRQIRTDKKHRQKAQTKSTGKKHRQKAQTKSTDKKHRQKTETKRNETQKQRAKTNKTFCRFLPRRPNCPSRPIPVRFGPSGLNRKKAFTRAVAPGARRGGANKGAEKGRLGRTAKIARGLLIFSTVDGQCGRLGAVVLSFGFWADWLPNRPKKRFSLFLGRKNGLLRAAPHSFEHWAMMIFRRLCLGGALKPSGAVCAARRPPGLCGRQ